MSIAVLSDIHGNFEALQTCIEYALKRNIRTFLFLGDYLGEMAFPQRTMEFLYRLNDTYSCIFIRGNKEDYWLKYHETKQKKWKEYDSTTGSLYYTYHNLTEKDIFFFRQMKISQIVSVGNMEPVTACHGSPRKVNEKLLPDEQNLYDVMEQSSTRLILCGHTHIQRKMEYQGKTVINPGSVGVPLQSCGKTQFLILHENGELWKEEFVSLSYDVEKEMKYLYEAGLDKRAPYWCKTTVGLLRTGKHAHSHILEKAMELCKAGTGECNWPEIPEQYWKESYELFYGQEDLQGYDCTYFSEEDAFPIPLEYNKIYESNWMTLYADKVKMPDGLIINTYHRVHIPNESVCVVMVNEQKEFLLIQSKRYTTGRMEWEIPAGRIEDGEDAESAARRECQEETGCEIKQLHYLCSQNPGNGITDLLIHYYMAQLGKEGEKFDENEVRNKRWVSKEEVITLLRNNGSRCGVSMFGLLYAIQFYL